MWVANAKERWMNFYQVYLASLVAKLRGPQAGALRETSEGAGRDLASYVGHLGMVVADVEDALALLNAAMGVADHLRVSVEGSVLEVRVHKPTCRMCPSVLDGGGQPTRECPLYGLVKGFLEGHGAASLEYAGLEPADGGEWCVLRYKLLAARLPRAEQAARAR